MKLAIVPVLGKARVRRSGEVPKKKKKRVSKERRAALRKKAPVVT